MGHLAGWFLNIWKCKYLVFSLALFSFLYLKKLWLSSVWCELTMSWQYLLVENGASLVFNYVHVECWCFSRVLKCLCNALLDCKSGVWGYDHLWIFSTFFWVMWGWFLASRYPICLLLVLVGKVMVRMCNLECLRWFFTFLACNQVEFAVLHSSFAISNLNPMHSPLKNLREDVDSIEFWSLWHS